MGARKFILMDPGDNVATAITALHKGEIVELAEGRSLVLRDDIVFGHKFALIDIAAGAEVIKYGQPIGRATQLIPAGAHVHVHNVEGQRGRGDKAQSHSELETASGPSPSPSQGHGCCCG